MAQVASAPRIRRRSLAGRVLAWVRERVATTPGKLVAISVLVGLVAVCFGLAAGIAERSRQHAAQAVRLQTEPVLRNAATLYASLSDANATATTTFLTGGLEPRTRRLRYQTDLQSATDSLSALTREVGNSPDARSALTTISRQLPGYTGLVETARANNRQGFPVGAAYLRAASDVLTNNTTGILPAAKRLYGIEAQRLSDSYRSGTSSTTLIVFVLAAVAALALLMATAVYLRRVSRRTFNVPLVAGTVALLALSIWGIAGFVREQNALAKAQREGSDPVQVLSATSILASRAQSDESLTLVNRGSDSQDPKDFTAIQKALGPLISEGAMLDARTRTSAEARALANDFAAYSAEHARIGRLERAGDIPDAISLEVGTEAGGRSPADRINANLAAQTAAAQARFSSSASDATSALSGLSIAIPVLTILAAALVLFGLRKRINEYR
jgi:hypothetical protein